jgi:hypothetical protein
MLAQMPDVDTIIADVINAQRDLIVENAVDEWLLAEKDILTEATTAADKMVDLHIDAKYDDESQYLEDDEEINALLDEEITEDIEGEADVFQDTMDEADFYDDDEVVEDVEDVLCPYDDIEALVADEDLEYVDSLISQQFI